MSNDEFKAYIASRMAAEKLDDLAEEFGVTRTTLYNWKAGQTPARIAVVLAEALSGSKQ